MKKNKFRFWILVCIVAISGFSQGMLLPLIAVLFETSGVSSFLNGLNATGLYIGILLASPFMEQPLRKYGYKPLIITGGFLVFVSLLLFPLWQSFLFWFFLRLLVGIGDHALNFGAQTWITAFSPEHKRGRNIAIYGLFFGIGFAVGPLMVPLVNINESLPFIISSLLSLFGWLFLFSLKNEFPDQEFHMSSFKDTFKRFASAWKYAWVAFLPPFAYGFLETSLNGSFPVYGLRLGLDVHHVSTLLVAFAIGGIIFQLPLGILSDKLGRKKILRSVLFLGFITFTMAGFLENSYIALNICLFLAGMFVGSTFSLGISYMTDLMPKNLLPTGNLLCGVFFSFGSLIGPTIGGLFIQLFQSISFFTIISLLYLTVFALTLVNRES
ncbi:Predicted arabinose efflux permease, MFS family [Gracilibacillus ureilyticus]|uniref:Predicted arabinose efflux permease, MFS family n=1 Tax=Gracilibacillus ureilyticus TaxID=531814 RepID=A0A1H9NCB0_9BACI|nr:MFS transporter [Gracilibacillus ureilyticus]SER33397.1 Predicted arabinose efflux permease, MFS family [Gracilibacillus ureilyticus]